MKGIDKSNPKLLIKNICDIKPTRYEQNKNTNGIFEFVNFVNFAGPLKVRGLAHYIF